MVRPLKVDRPQRFEIRLPNSIYTKLVAELYSEVEGRVPLGALSELSEVLFTDWLKSRGVIL